MVALAMAPAIRLAMLASVAGEGEPFAEAAEDGAIGGGVVLIGEYEPDLNQIGKLIFGLGRAQRGAFDGRPLRGLLRLSGCWEMHFSRIRSG
jgi:hypothetical protein